MRGRHQAGTTTQQEVAPFPGAPKAGRRAQAKLSCRQLGSNPQDGDEDQDGAGGCSPSDDKDKDCDHNDGDYKPEARGGRDRVRRNKHCVPAFALLTNGQSVAAAQRSSRPATAHLQPEQAPVTRRRPQQDSGHRSGGRGGACRNEPRVASPRAAEG